MSDKPTETAESLFNLAHGMAVRARQAGPPDPSVEILQHMAAGLMNLSVGLRATYMEIEELKRTIKAQATARKP